MTDENTAHIHQTPQGQEVIVLWPKLLTPEAFKDKNGVEKGNPRYSAELLIDADNSAPFKAAAKAAAMKKHGTTSGVTWPFKSGEKRADQRAAQNKDGEMYCGKVILPVKAFPPDDKNPSGFNPKDNVLVLDHGVLRDAEPRDLYSGMGGLVVVAFAGNFQTVQERDPDTGEVENKKIPNVSCYLRSYVKTGEGKRIGGNTGRQAFAGVVGQVSDENPEEGMDSSDDEMMG